MPVTLMCSACGKTAPVGDDASTVRHWCKSCGTIMRIVYTKHCVGCHVDLTNGKRVKDSVGNYYCPACWEVEAKRQVERREAEEQALAAGELFPCRVCRKNYLVDQVYAEPTGKTICKTCWAAVSAQAAQQATAQAAKSVLPGLDVLEPMPPQADPDLPDGLELLPPEPVGLRPDELFCESCNRIFRASELTTGADGSVLCTACVKYREKF